MKQKLIKIFLPHIFVGVAVLVICILLVLIFPLQKQSACIPNPNGTGCVFFTCNQNTGACEVWNGTGNKYITINCNNQCVPPLTCTPGSFSECSSSHSQGLCGLSYPSGDLIQINRDGHCKYSCSDLGANAQCSPGNTRYACQGNSCTVQANGPYTSPGCNNQCGISGNACGCTPGGGCGLNGAYCENPHQVSGQNICNGTTQVFDIYQCSGGTWQHKYLQNGGSCPNQCNTNPSVCSGVCNNLQPSLNNTYGGCTDRFPIGDPAGDQYCQDKLGLYNPGAGFACCLPGKPSNGTCAGICDTKYDCSSQPQYPLYDATGDSSCQAQNSKQTVYCCVPAVNAIPAHTTLNVQLTDHVLSTKLNKTPLTMYLYPVTNPIALASRVLGLSVITATDALFSTTGTSFANPWFFLGKLVPGQYQFFVHADKYLDRQVLSVTNSPVLSIANDLSLATQTQPVSLIPGDIAPLPHGDNYIDILDFNLMVNCMKYNHATCPDPSVADLNGDGIVDQKDLDILMSHFGELGQSYNPPDFTCVTDPNCKNTQGGVMQMCSLLCTKKPVTQ